MEINTPSPVAIVDRRTLQTIVREYVVASRCGDTLSYRASAELDVDTAAMSSTDVLWKAFEAQGLVAEAGELLESEMTYKPDEDRFVATEDIVAGQVCVVDEKGQIRGLAETVEAATSGAALDVIDASELFG